MRRSRLGAHYCSRSLWLLIALVPVMFWSRVTLGRHRPFELVVGLVLGVATGVALVRL